MINLTDKHVRALTWVINEASKHKDPVWGQDDHMTADAVERMFRDARSGLVVLQALRVQKQLESNPGFRVSHSSEDK